MTEEDRKNDSVVECRGLGCKEILDKLSEYIDGELDPKICQDLEHHMKDCNPCLLFIDSLKKTITLYKYASAESLPKEVHLRLHEYLKKECKDC
ncbi:MAG: zf-HC2 domain-containing protein [Deltaproteobacteria bacterium]|jgi:anti-sigma factor RsiW|nr:zf-HC2 domain-containing protein [Deltaproteobacteria bacterium]